MGFMGLPNLSGFEGTVELFLQLAVNSVLSNKVLPFNLCHNWHRIARRPALLLAPLSLCSPTSP